MLPTTELSLPYTYINETPSDPLVRSFYEDLYGRHEIVTKETKPIKKEIFSIRHPKIYQKWRKIRKTCIKITPVVDFLGSVGQIITPIVIR